MKESLLILVLLLLSTLGIRAQSNTVSIGGEASGSGGTSSFTSGQVFYEYKTNTTISVTEGVQQGLITGTTTASSATACDSYTWAANGTTYTTSGSYTNTTTNTAGSTNVETLTLTINNITTTTSSATACDNYYWSANGETYTTSGSYTNTTTNTAGCPANQVLNLTVTPSFTNTTNTSAVGTYTWENNGQTYTSSGVYNGTTVNCVTQVLNLTITPFTATLSLQVFLDGYYINSSNPSSMRPARYNNLVASGSANPGANTDVDIITVELRSLSNLNVVSYSVSPILQTNGNVQCIFPAGALVGSYYIVVKHRAAIPLWSGNPVSLSASTAYSFADNAVNAYSDGSITPMHTLVPSLFGIWLGELNDDGYLDGTDYPTYESNVILSSYGGLYMLDGDLNGDSYVDAADYGSVFDYNSRQGVYEQRPY